MDEIVRTITTDSKAKKTISTTEMITKRLPVGLGVR
jgi:hypothetical protein